mgnify:CR=1 FL=1|jgi:hypothetical protein
MAEEFNGEAIQKELLELINKARKDPSFLIPILEERYHSFKDKMWLKGDKWFNSREGNVAVKEAIEYLKEHKPLPEISSKNGCYLAAKEHAEDMAKSGVAGHTGSNGSTMSTRIDKQGRWKGGISENVAFSQYNALDFLLYWIVDDGMASRADRKNLFNPAFKVCGIAAGPHPKFKTCVVLVLTGDLAEGEKGREATKLLNEYEKAGFDQLGVNGQVFNYGDMQKALKSDMGTDLNQDWIPGAVSVRTEKSIVKDGDKEKTVFIFYYTMGDGSIVTREKEFDTIVPNK